MSDSGLFSSFYTVLCATRNNERRGMSVLSNAPILPRAVDKTVHKGLILGDGHYQCSGTRCLPRNLPVVFYCALKTALFKLHLANNAALRHCHCYLCTLHFGLVRNKDWAYIPFECSCIRKGNKNINLQANKIILDRS